MKLIPKVKVYIEDKLYVVGELKKKRIYFVSLIKKMNSHRGYIDNIYDYVEDVICYISDIKRNWKSYEFINLICLNLDENNTTIKRGIN